MMETQNSNQYVKTWRKQIQEDVYQECRPLWDQANTKQLEDQIVILDNESEMTSNIAFHPFEPLIVVSSEPNVIGVWNWELGERLTAFVNSGTESRLTDVKIINETGNAMLLTASSNGIVRIWRDFVDDEKRDLASSWVAVTDLMGTSSSCGVILDWQPENGFLLAGGDSDIIRIWDVEKELALTNMSTGAECSLTTLVSEGTKTVAGFSDGTIRTYDSRMPQPRCVNCYDEHSGWIVGLHLLQNSKLVSGSVTGEVKFWDINQGKSSTKSLNAFTDNAMTSLAVHKYASVFACGSQQQKIRVMNFEGEELSMIRYHDGFLGQRVGAISCLAFHDVKILLGAGATDSIISVYSS